jgi:hypothetical protein
MIADRERFPHAHHVLKNTSKNPHTAPETAP